MHAHILLTSCFSCLVLHGSCRPFIGTCFCLKTQLYVVHFTLSYVLLSEKLLSISGHYCSCPNCFLLHLTFVKKLPRFYNTSINIGNLNYSNT